VAEDMGSGHSVPSGLEYAASWAASAALTEVVRAGELDSLCRAILRHTADATLTAAGAAALKHALAIREGLLLNEERQRELLGHPTLHTLVGEVRLTGQFARIDGVPDVECELLHEEGCWRVRLDGGDLALIEPARLEIVARIPDGAELTAERLLGLVMPVEMRALIGTLLLSAGRPPTAEPTAELAKLPAVWVMVLTSVRADAAVEALLADAHPDGAPPLADEALVRLLRDAREVAYQSRLRVERPQVLFDRPALPLIVGPGAKGVRTSARAPGADEHVRSRSRRKHHRGKHHRAAAEQGHAGGAAAGGGAAHSERRQRPRAARHAADEPPMSSRSHEPSPTRAAPCARPPRSGSVAMAELVAEGAARSAARRAARPPARQRDTGRVPMDVLAALEEAERCLLQQQQQQQATMAQSGGWGQQHGYWGADATALNQQYLAQYSTVFATDPQWAHYAAMYGYDAAQQQYVRACQQADEARRRC
jgi:hypothetical protein